MVIQLVSYIKIMVNLREHMVKLECLNDRNKIGFKTGMFY